MAVKFPAHREEKRFALLSAVEGIRERLAANADEAEALGTLPPDTVEALYDSGLLAYKTPEDMGGAEADPLLQMEVVEEVTRIDPAAGWCLMIGSASVANMAAFLPEEGLVEVFTGGRIPKAAGVFAPSGRARPVEGGYEVTGQWSFGSGVRHSEWISAGAWVVDDEGLPGKQVRVVFPTGDVCIHDNWQVMGLRGTGSCDYSVDRIFVPERLSWEVTEALPRRGGPFFLLGRPGMVTTGHCAFALGVGQLALDSVIDMATEKERGYAGSMNLVANRGSFQRTLGECDLRLRAAKALVVETLSEAWESVCRGVTPEPPLQTRMRSAASFSTEEAAEIAAQCFRFGGGTALQQSHPLQKCLRDINAAAQHQMVSDSAYENHGQFMLGLPGASPMG